MRLPALQGLRSALGRRLILAIVLVSSAVTLVITALDLHRQYRRDMDAVHNVFRQIENVHLKALSQAAWSTDERGLRLQVDGIEALPYIERVAVLDEGIELVKAGTRESTRVLRRGYPLTYPYRGMELEVATLAVVVGLDPVYEALLASFATVLAGNAVKTFLVAVFALLFFEWVAIRHLRVIADHLHALDLSRDAPDLRLGRPAPRRPDELDVVVESVNRMAGANRAALDALRDSEAQVRQLNSELERRVRERTAQLEHANRELDAFSYSVSHDLRAPVRAVGAYARMLEARLEERPDPECQRLIDRIKAAEASMTALIESLIEFSRSARAPLRPAPVDLAALAAAVADDLRREYPATEMVIGALPPARGDATLLREVVANLLGNGCKFSAKSARPRVEMGFRPGAQGGTYFVRDNGAGFDPRAAANLFEPFQRLHRDADYPGAGVGLALCKRIIERHGGRIFAESVPGAGATFYFTLPQTSDAAPPAVRSRGPDAAALW